MPTQYRTTVAAAPARLVLGMQSFPVVYCRQSCQQPGAYCRNGNAKIIAREKKVREKMPWEPFPPVTPDFASLAWRLSADELVERSAHHRTHPGTAEEEQEAAHAFETEQIEHRLKNTAAAVDGAHPPLERVESVARRKNSDMDFWHRQELPFKSFHDQHDGENLAYAEDGTAERLYQMQISLAKMKEKQRESFAGVKKKDQTKPQLGSVIGEASQKMAPQHLATMQAAEDPLLAAIAFVAIKGTDSEAKLGHRTNTVTASPSTLSSLSSRRSSFTHSRVSSLSSPDSVWNIP